MALLRTRVTSMGVFLRGFGMFGMLGVSRMFRAPAAFGGLGGSDAFRGMLVLALSWFLGGFAVLGPSPCVAENTPPYVDAASGTRSVAVGDTFRLNLKLAWKEGTDVKPVAVPDKIGNFVVKDITEGPVSTSAGTSARDVSLLLTAFETGAQTVPPISIVYMNVDGTSGKIETKPIEMEVKSILPENAADIRDIKHPIKVPKRWKDIILSYALIVGLAVGAALSVLVSFKRKEEIESYARRFWRKVYEPLRRLILRLLALLGFRRARETLTFDIRIDEPGLLPGEAALKEIDRIEALGLIERNLIREFCTLVSETMRRYIERQSGVLAMESPTSYTLRALSGLEIPRQAYGLIEDVLGECDLVKFAKHTPSTEAVRSLIERSRNIVNLTANLSLVPDAWIMAQQFGGANARVDVGRRPGEETVLGSRSGIGSNPGKEPGLGEEPGPEGGMRGASRGGARGGSGNEV